MKKKAVKCTGACRSSEKAGKPVKEITKSQLLYGTGDVQLELGKDDTADLLTMILNDLCRCKKEVKEEAEFKSLYSTDVLKIVMDIDAIFGQCRGDVNILRKTSFCPGESRYDITASSSDEAAMHSLHNDLAEYIQSHDLASVVYILDCETNINNELGKMYTTVRIGIMSFKQNGKTAKKEKAKK